MAPPPKPYFPSYQREYLVDRSFQLKYALLAGTLGFSVSIVGGAVMYAVLRTTLSQLALPPEFWPELAKDRGTIAAVIVATALGVALLLGLVTLLLTHRIAGPIYVMTRYVAVLAEGHFPKMRKLRRTDEFKDLFDLFQKSVEYLRTRDVADAFRLEEAIAQLNPHATTPEARAAVESLKVLRDRKRAIAERADFDATTLFAAPNAPDIPVPPRTSKNLLS